jgi:glycerol uptake facilitator-like aquaporin
VFQNLAAGTVALYLAAQFAGAALAAALAKAFYGEEPGASLKAALS